MTPQELKNSILQRAIQGKLVEQRSEEGTAEELYQQIQAEKRALIKAGKIKKEKPLPEIAEEEKPFDIPESWKWVRLGDCSSYAQTKAKISPNEITSEMWSLDLEDIEKETGRILNYCKAAERKITGEKVCFSKGQILYSKLRPYLKKILVAPNDGICTPELVPFDIYGQICTDYIANVLRAPHVDYVINAVTYGVKMPRVGTETMVNLLIPLPPLAEQKRIVAMIEELLPLIDRYEAAYTRLEEFNKRFPGDMQKSLLQTAIQGKLVEQRPEEGTGEELFRQIQAEKQALIKAGKIKKDKPLPEITDDEKPFDIPESWKWVRLLSVVDIATNLVQPTAYQDYMHIAPDNIEKATGRLLECHTVKEDKVASANHLFHKGQIIYSKIRPLLRKVVIAPFDGLCSADMYPLNTELDTQYVLYYLLSDGFNLQIAEAMSSRVKMPKINQDELSKTLLPLPPIAEQKRIVAKLDELLPLCERLR